MLSLEDCIEFSNLAKVEVEAIAQHEHVPLVVAAELGCAMLKTESGTKALASIIHDCAEGALRHGHTEDAERFMLAYVGFRAAHH